MPDPNPIKIPPRGTRGTRTAWAGPLVRLAKPLIDMQISHPAFAGGSEREDALARVAAIAPRYGEYQKKPTGRSRS